MDLTEKFFIALLSGYGVLSSVIVYLYHRQQQQQEINHAREIKTYQERITRRDTENDKLNSEIDTMQSRLDSIYQRVLDRYNGRDKNGVLPKG